MGARTGRQAPRQLAATDAAGRIARATALLECGEATLRTIARRYSVSHDEAEDAFARAVETLLTKGPDLPPPRLMAWMKVVTRHEAINGARYEARRRPATASETGDVIEPDWFATALPGPEEELDRRERVARYAERLSRLKPQERRALALFGAGCSYAEIQAITGWTYTKVNRCVNEGRAALRKQAEAVA